MNEEQIAADAHKRVVLGVDAAAPEGDQSVTAIAVKYALVPVSELELLEEARCELVNRYSDVCSLAFNSNISQRMWYIANRKWNTVLEVERPVTYSKPNEPCTHPSCKSHQSHPCEGCGRKWA